MLVLVNLEDGIPPNLVRDVLLENLDEHGDYEIIRVAFPVLNMTAEEAAKEVEPLLGPQGTVIVLPQSKRIQVTETGGRLRTIRSVINAVESPTDVDGRHPRDHAQASVGRRCDAVFAAAAGDSDRSLQHSRQPAAHRQRRHRLEAAGPWHAGTGCAGGASCAVDRRARCCEGHFGGTAVGSLSDHVGRPAGSAEVLKTLLEGDASVKLAVDPVTGHLVAFARPAQQATIAATVDQMQRDARQVAVIPLSTVDPQVAVLSITKLFGGLDKEKPDPSAPRVDADITTQSLLVRGTAGQVQQIKDLLAQMGETEEAGGGVKSNEHVRLLPLTGPAARSALAANRADLADDAAESHPGGEPVADDSDLPAERRSGA